MPDRSESGDGKEDGGERRWEMVEKEMEMGGDGR